MGRTRWLVPVVIILFIWTMTMHGKFSNSGDEPHYLTIAESLRFDGDLDLENNYGAGNNWTGDGPSEAGAHAERTRQGRLWSVHGIGLPVLLLPVYIVATFVATHIPDSLLASIKQPRGLFAYSIISLSLIVFTAWAIAMLIGTFRRIGTLAAATAVGLALALSPPVLSHAFLVFAETPAFVVTCVVIWLLYRSESELTRGRVAAVVLAAGVMPWLHRKYIFFSLSLLVLLLQQHWAWFRRQPRGVLIALGAMALVPQAALHLWTLYAWGSIGGPQLNGVASFTITGMPTGGFGLLFDRERGLLSYAPIYLIVPACWALGWRESRRFLVPVLSLFLPMAAFPGWNAGFSPAARFLVPLTPLLMLPVVRALDYPWVRRAAVFLAVFQTVLTLYLWQHPRALWPKELGTNAALDGIPVIGPVYERWLPSILTGDSSQRGWIWVAVIAASSAAIVLLSRRETVTKA